MSLIQDALKRQQEDSENSRVPPADAPARNAGAAPAVPDAMPVPPSPTPTLGLARRGASPEPESPSLAGEPSAAAESSATAESPADPGQTERPGKSRKLVAGIIIFCILIILGGGLWMALTMKQAAGRTLLGQFVPYLTKVQVILGKSSVKVTPPAAQPPAMAAPKPAAITTPAPAPASSPWISPAAAAAPAFADEGEDAEEAAALTPGGAGDIAQQYQGVLSNAGPAQDAVRAPPVIWPRLKLSAVFSQMGSGQSGARLNNRLIILGDQIDGVILVEIRRDSVVLKCGTETRTLKMGMTLN